MKFEFVAVGQIAGHIQSLVDQFDFDITLFEVLDHDIEDDMRSRLIPNGN